MTTRPAHLRGLLLLLSALVAMTGCRTGTDVPPADLLLVNGRVYTLAWDEPGLDGAPSRNAPRTSAGWQPDAQAIAVRGNVIALVGSDEEARLYRSEATRVIDLAGATVIPGLIESHVHIQELGQSLSRVDVRGLDTEEAIVAKVREAATRRPPGEWIEGYGWDEGAWAARLPTLDLLSKEVPDHPVYLKGLHGFSVWGNRLALERAGIDRRTKAPIGGTIVKDEAGRPTGILTNRAVTLLEAAIPPPTDERRRQFVLDGLQAVARAGYVAVHEAGADTDAMRAFEVLASSGRLPLRVYAMLAARDDELMKAWLARGPGKDVETMLVVRSVKAFYDAALGSRGARLLEDYTDRPGHRGVSGGEYGFNQPRAAEMMRAGFQMVIHAIGDAGNRETLDFLESVIRERPETRAGRHRVEHAQVLHPDDVPRFAALDVIASMQPPHAVEDKTWAEDRLGPQRVRGAYAWRTLRKAGARLAFNSDLPGSDCNFFYGIHSAVSRRDKNLQPQGGWYPDERMTPEEALRGYTIWGAYSAFMEQRTGTLQAGKWADITVIDLDVLNVSETEPAKLLQGKVLYTIVAGKVVFQAQ